MKLQFQVCMAPMRHISTHWRFKNQNDPLKECTLFFQIQVTIQRHVKLKGRFRKHVRVVLALVNLTLQRFAGGFTTSGLAEHLLSRRLSSTSHEISRTLQFFINNKRHDISSNSIAASTRCFS